MEQNALPEQPHEQGVTYNTKSIVEVGVFTSLIILGSYISFPLPGSPVPVSLQTYFVVFAGIILGPKRGALSGLLYLVLGAVGFPVFAQGTSGLGILLGPTGGYLVGFITGAWSAGIVFHTPLFWQKNTTFNYKSSRMFLGGICAGAVGFLFVYIPGLLWLSFSLRTGILQTLGFGLIPFLIGDSVKLLACGATAGLGKHLFKPM